MDQVCWNSREEKGQNFPVFYVGAKLYANFARRLNLTGTQGNVNGPQNQKNINIGEIFKYSVRVSYSLQQSGGMVLAAGVLFLTLCLLSFGPTQVEVFTIPGRSSPFPFPPLPKGWSSCQCPKCSPCIISRNPLKIRVAVCRLLFPACCRVH